MNAHDERGPGYNNSEFLRNIPEKEIKYHVGRLMRFIHRDDVFKKRCADVGESNPKMELLSACFRTDVTQIECADFNFDHIEPRKYDCIFCFEVLEHIQNPLWLLREMREALADDGVIYLSMPHSPRWLWPDFHFNEISRDHFEHWLCNPLGLRIVRHRKFNHVSNWKAALIGFRPLVRFLRTRDLRPILSQLVQRNNHYEIRKEAWCAVNLDQA